MSTATTEKKAPVAPVANETAPASVIETMAKADKYLGVHDLGHGVKMNTYEKPDGSRYYTPYVPELTAIEKKQAELNETAKAENDTFFADHAKLAKLNGLSYIVTKPNCMKVSYKVVESQNSPDGMRVVTNKSLSRLVKFSDIWELTDDIMAPVLQARDMLPGADSKESVKKAVWPVAKACGRAVPGYALKELLQSLRKYRQVSVKGVKLNSYENVANDVETVLVQFLNTCPLMSDGAKE